MLGPLQSSWPVFVAPDSGVRNVQVQHCNFQTPTSFFLISQAQVIPLPSPIISFQAPFSNAILFQVICIHIPSSTLFWTSTLAMAKDGGAKATTTRALKSKPTGKKTSKKPAQSHPALPSSSRHKLSFWGFIHDTCWCGCLSDLKSEKWCIFHHM